MPTEGTACEEFAGATGCVTTRAYLPDFCNGLVWQSFPLVKRALLVVRELDAGRALVDDLRTHRWHEALFARRALFGSDVQVWLFGHALMGKLVAGACRAGGQARKRRTMPTPAYSARSGRPLRSKRD